MNQDWQHFLQSQQARIDNGIVQDFGDAGAERAAARDASLLCDLSQSGLLRVSGKDAQTFLQSLLSNDIREVNGQRAQLSSLNDPKGRMIASFLVCRIADDYLLQLPRVLCEPVRKRLSMYVLRAKVTLADESANWRVHGAQTRAPDDPDVIVTVKYRDRAALAALDAPQNPQLAALNSRLHGADDMVVVRRAVTELVDG